MRRFPLMVAALAAWFSTTLSAAMAQEAGSPQGWMAISPTPAQYRFTTDMASPCQGKGCAKIAAPASAAQGRACLEQEFFGKNALRPGYTYSYSVRYRTSVPFAGYGQVLIDAYAREGEKSHQSLVSIRLPASGQWTAIAGKITVPRNAVRVRMLLYLHGAGTIRYDEARFALEPDGRNLLANGGFEPSLAAAYDVAPEKGLHQVTFFAAFENSTLGRVKEVGPNEFYVYAFPDDKPRSPFVWFHYRLEGCRDREVTIHMNLAPFTKEKTARDGNGTRTPVMSYDQDTWVGIDDKSWNADGSVLTFKQRFTRSPAWICSFFPFTPDHAARFIAACQADPKHKQFFSSRSLGKTKQGRDMRLYTITDPAVPEAQKRVVLFTALQHDLETTGAMVVEGMSRWLLSDDARAARLRRAAVFHVVPVMDPDGVAQGNLYCPVGNLNRQWGLGTTAETTCVERFVRELGAGGRPVELYIDFHGWCTPQRTTEFLGFGKQITSPAEEADSAKLFDTIKRRITGKTVDLFFRKRVETVTGITSDLARLAPGWMKFEAGARHAFCIEIFGEGTCTQQQYFEWGRNILAGIADYYKD
jgi:hypothetical protein